MAGDREEDWEEVIVLNDQDEEQGAEKVLNMNGAYNRRTRPDMNGKNGSDVNSAGEHDHVSDNDILSQLSFMSMTSDPAFSSHDDWTKNFERPPSPKVIKAKDDDSPLNIPPDNGMTILDILPWEDVLISRILPFLDMRDLFQLRQVSCGFRDVVGMYFAANHHLDLSDIGPEFSTEAFRVVTVDATNLTTLNVANCKKWITDDLLLPVIDVNNNLRVIDISENSSLSINVVRRIAFKCPELLSLSLAECQQVTSTAVECIGMNCDHLERLDLQGCWAMDDETLSLVLQLHPHLKWLSVARAYGVTDLLVDEICRHCPNIEYLDVQGCWRITDAAVRQLWNLESLKTLKVKDCRHITERSLARFRTKGVQIDILLPEESDLAKLERHLRAREFARARSIPPNFAY